MNAQEMWEQYSSSENIHTCYAAWAFGDDADALADLVDRGTKTATASLLFWYELEEEPLPQPGAYSIILDSEENAVCIIRTERVSVIPFQDVDEGHAWKEGEGDRSLSYWRSVHEEFFRGELEAAGQTFDERMNVVCEEFIKVYP